MASSGSDQNAEYALSKLLQMGMVAEYESEFVILANQVTGISANLLKSFYISGLKLELQRELFRSRPTTLGEAFSFARIAKARFEDERSTIAIVKPNELTAHVHVQDLEQITRGRGDEPNRILLVTIHHMIYPITVEVLNQIFSPHGYVEKVVIFQKSAHVQALIQFQSRQNAIVARNSLQGCNIYEGCCQLDIQFSNLEELQDNQEEHICYYYWENCFSILNTEEAGNTKSPLSANTFGNGGVDESETSGLETPAKEVVDNGNGSALICLVGYDTGSEVVTGLPEEFQEGDMVDALSRVLEQKSSEKGVDSGSGRQDYILFEASLFVFLNPGPGYFARRRIWIPESISLQDNTLRARWL
ncbi:polypyrimidine tract-binding protein homolog 3 [Tanacetum coccineum]